MPDSNESVIELRILAVLCTFVFFGILVAGLWPFRSPRNEVTWLRNVNGLRFGHYGTILSSGAFATPISQEEGPCSLEIRLQPRRNDETNTVLAFYSPDNQVQFSLHQYQGDLILERPENLLTRPRLAYVHDILPHRIGSCSSRSRQAIVGRLSMLMVPWPRLLRNSGFPIGILLANSS